MKFVNFAIVGTETLLGTDTDEKISVTQPETRQSCGFYRLDAS